jgi:hypothetical protein
MRTPPTTIAPTNLLAAHLHMLALTSPTIMGVGVWRIPLRLSRPLRGGSQAILLFSLFDEKPLQFMHRRHTEG